MSSDDGILHGGNSISDGESDDDDDQFDECDSGAGSDDFDLLELGQSGEEFCQVGDQTCSFPYELYDLPGLKHVLSIEVWNDILTEEDRFSLAKYLPDMDQDDFVLTLKELFSCENLHFGSPVNRLFEMLKEGSCEPRVAHYRQGLNFLQRKRHYHKIREYQNAMVSNLLQMRDAWVNCEGYSIEEKLRVLNVKKCQKSLMNENLEEFGSDSSDRQGSDDEIWGRKANFSKVAPKFSGYAIGLNSDKHVRKIPKGTLKAAKSNDNSVIELSKDKPTSQCPNIKELIIKPSDGAKFRDRGAKPNFTKNFQQNTHSGFFPADSSYTHMDLNSKNMKQKLGREAVDLVGNDKFLRSEHREKTLPEKFNVSAISHCGRYVTENTITQALDQSDETESDSVDGDDGNDYNDNPLMRMKLPYPLDVPDMKYGPDNGMVKISMKHAEDTFPRLDASFQPSSQMDDDGKDLDFIKSERRGSAFQCDDWQQRYLLERNGLVEEIHGKSLSQKSSLAPGKKVKTNNGVSVKFWKRGRVVDPSAGDHPEISGNSELSLMSYAAPSKKRKGRNMDSKYNKDGLYDDAILFDGVNPLGRSGKVKVEDACDVCENEVFERPSNFEVELVEEQTKPQNKSFPVITPTSLTGFSFSIIHLLSSVRVAMITMLPKDLSEYGIQDERHRKQEDKNLIESVSEVDAKILFPPEHESIQHLPVQEIVNRVRSNPVDPAILETQEPLQDLIRGVLKIFASRTAPLGAKGWKPLVVYEKPTKSWSWIGPIACNNSDSETIEEVTSPDAWGLPRKMLVKLVDSFATWLKNSQEALQQIGSLPAPPLELMQKVLDEKERFKDLRAQKSLNTISPNPEEVRSYFQKEEVLRYSIPDRAFSYTAVDGKRTFVAPLRRCGGKPTSKARDHFMLKKDRPPHVTILCLVRDAAARLPGSIGTRADVCTLIRDSQYIVEDVSDAQINQVVSGALDRLHYERDPCVQFDGERKLWVYLHREREEEDFEDDGTSSTKKWRRQKKESSDPSDPPLEQSGCAFVSDLHFEASCVDSDKMLENESHHDNDPMMENAEFAGGTEM